MHKILSSLKGHLSAKTYFYSVFFAKHVTSHTEERPPADGEIFRTMCQVQQMELSMSKSSRPLDLVAGLPEIIYLMSKSSMP